MLEATSHLVVTDPYLQGNHAPVLDELDIQDLPVRGRVPDDLAGVYMRNGPNPKYEPIAYTYPFDGDGMVHAVYFERGKARYRNRFVRTAGLAVEDRAGRAVYGSVADPKPPDPSLLGPGDPPLIKDAANINVIEHGGHYLALYESDLPYELTRELETVGPFDFAGAIPGMTAHPRFDATTGELHFFTYGFERPYLNYYVADSSGKVVVDRGVDLPQPTMMHDFVITERRVLFFDCPVVFDFAGIAKGQSPLEWKPELGTRLVVLDRGRPDQAPVTIDADPFWVFHFVNAYDRGEDEVVIDYVRHRFLGFGTDMGDPHPTMYRMTLDLRTGKAKEGPVEDPTRLIEFPRADGRLNGRPYRLAYAAQRSRTETGSFEAIVQYDLDSGSAKSNELGEGRHPGEPCFVPRPGGGAEDDGYLVTFVYDADRDASDLVLVDARDFDGDPVATIELPVRVPFGLHGNWIAIEDG